jgi:hypothetical protein
LSPAAKRSDATTQPDREPRRPRQPGTQGDDQAERDQGGGLLEQSLEQAAPERLDRLAAYVDLDLVGDRRPGDAQGDGGHDHGDDDPDTGPGQHAAPIRGQGHGGGDQHEGHDRQRDRQPLGEIHGLAQFVDLRAAEGDDLADLLACGLVDQVDPAVLEALVHPFDGRA